MLAREKVNHALQVAAGRADPIKTRDEIFKEEGGRYIDFLVPGLIGMGLMGGGMWGVGFTIVDMRIKKLLKRFLATPMNRMHFLIAAMISRVIILIPELCIQLAFAYFIFGVRNHGSWLLFVALIIVGELVFSSIGLLVASRAKTIDAISGLMNLTMLPMWILSGVFFSSDNYPQALQPLIKILPLTAVNNALRAVMQDGYGIGQIWYELTVMAVWTVICLPIALRIFRLAVTFRNHKSNHRSAAENNSRTDRVESWVKCGDTFRSLDKAESSHCFEPDCGQKDDQIELRLAKDQSEINDVGTCLFISRF